MIVYVTPYYEDNRLVEVTVDTRGDDGEPVVLARCPNEDDAMDYVRRRPDLELAGVQDALVPADSPPDDGLTSFQRGIVRRTGRV